jgi:uncharacterized membrane protein YoaK (UPF0700 family)
LAVDAAAAGGPPTDAATARRLVVVALLAAGMGLRSATVRRLAVPEVTTTVVTSTITALAADSAVPGAGFTRRLWRLATIAIRLAGAVAGALLVRVSLFVPCLLVASLIASRPARISLRSSSVRGAAADLHGGPAGGS